MLARVSFGELLIARGFITSEKLMAARLEQKVTNERIGKILVRNGFLRQDDLFRLLLETNPNQLHDETVFQSIVPPEVLLETRSMIVARAAKVLYIGTMSSPALVRSRFAPFITGFRIAFTAVNPARLEQYLREVQKSAKTVLLSWERIFHDAMRARASDIHIIPRNYSYTVKTRIDGVLNLTHEGPLDEYSSLVSRVKDLARMDMAERRRPQDGGFTMDYSGRIVSFRVVTVPTVHGERMVVRILDPDAVNLSLDTLGISELATWRRITSKPSGLCLICGPTGSGKTTTLASTVRDMNFLERAVYSIEDPVENLLPYAGQVNVNPVVGLDFSNAVRNFLRADPDVIIVGEVRDIETARNALKAAETGHLVLATLHTGSITTAVARLRDIGVQPYELRHLLLGVLVQRLIRVYCTECHGRGCAHCNHTGFSGREVVSEVAQFRDEYEVDRVINGETFWTPMQEDAHRKVTEGKTSQREFERVFGIVDEEKDDK